MTEETKQIVDSVLEGTIEALKFIPVGEAAEVKEYLLEKLATADYSGAPNIVTIIHSAVHSGKLIAKKTPKPGDDKFFGILDNIVENFRDNGEKAVAALWKSIFQKADKE